MLMLLMLAAATVDADPQPLPEPVVKMIQAAVATKDATKIKTVVELAKATNPDSVAAINALLPPPPKSNAPFGLTGWSGKVEAGGSASTGNSDHVGLAFTGSLKHKGARWEHAFDAMATYENATGSDRIERYRASYSNRYKLGDGLYSTGLLMWERDRPAGYYRRSTQSLGLGYRVISSSRFQLDVEGGPALREVGYIDEDNDVTVSGRASVSALWKIADNASLSNQTSTYLEAVNRTVSSTTALTTRIFGPLSAKLAFDLQHESDPPDGLKKTDTTSRASLVYSF